MSSVIWSVRPASPSKCSTGERRRARQHRRGAQAQPGRTARPDQSVGDRGPASPGHAGPCPHRRGRAHRRAGAGGCLGGGGPWSPIHRAVWRSRCGGVCRPTGAFCGAHEPAAERLQVHPPSYQRGPERQGERGSCAHSRLPTSAVAWPTTTSTRCFAPSSNGTRTGPGWGWDCAFSQWGVEANDGRISVRNLPEHGCVFTVDLPRVATPVMAMA